MFLRHPHVSNWDLYCRSLTSRISLLGHRSQSGAAEATTTGVLPLPGFEPMLLCQSLPDLTERPVLGEEQRLNGILLLVPVCSS